MSDTVKIACVYFYLLDILTSKCYNFYTESRERIAAVKHEFSAKDKEKLEKLEITRRRGFRLLDLYSNFLNLEPDFIKKELIDELVSDCGVSVLEAYTAVLAAAFDIDSDERDEDLIFENEYLKKSVELLDPDVYKSSSYLQKIKFPTVKRANWEMRTSSYAPFEAFVCREITVEDDLKELPHIGFFTERFDFPSVFENGREWMTVTPNEIETMRSPLSEAHGRVITLGLGLGYFAHQASEKENVSSVTVIERDESAISLFSEFILPQFEHKDKIKIIRADALEYLEKNDPEERFDFMFADLWHDSSDGLALYIKLKSIEKKQKREESSSLVRRYWIENSILSRLRWLIYSEIVGENSKNLSITSYGELVKLLSNESLASIAGDIKNISL